MAAEQFSQAVRGTGGVAIQTTAEGSIQTDNYDYGASFEYDGSNYPYTVDNPDNRVIQDLMLTEAGDIDMEVTTIKDDAFTVRLAETIGRWQIWEIETVTFSDPRGTEAALYGAWGGE